MKRLAAALRLEARVQLRYGIVPAALALGAAWTLMLFVVPVEAAGTVAVYLLFIDAAAFGALFVAALLLFERTEATRQALTVTPLRSSESVAARLLALTLVSLIIALPMIVAGVRDRLEDLARILPAALGGVALISLLLLTLCLAVGARSRDLSGFLLTAPPLVAPLIVLPLTHVSGILEHPLMYVVPTTVGADLIRLGTAPESLGASPTAVAVEVLHSSACVALGVFLAHRAVKRGAVPPPHRNETGRDTTPSERPVTGRGRLPAIVRFVRIDLFGIGRDPLLLLMLCAPLLLALVIRLVFPPASEFLLVSHGFDLAPHTPVVLAVLVLLHVPMIFGVVGGLRATEDSDENILLVLRASPVSMSAYLGYRLTLVTVLSLVGLAVALPLSGLMTSTWSPSVVVAVVLAALQAPLLTVVMTAVATNKVEALVVVKGVGAFLALTPLAAWLLPSPWNLLLSPLPPSWPALALPGYDAGPLGAWACLAGGLVVFATASALLLRRTSYRFART